MYAATRTDLELCASHLVDSLYRMPPTTLSLAP